MNTLGYLVQAHALNNAAARGQTDILYRLIRQGADPNWRNENGVPALHMASLHGYVKSLCTWSLAQRSRRTEQTYVYACCPKGSSAIDIVMQTRFRNRSASVMLTSKYVACVALLMEAALATKIELQLLTTTL